MRYSVESRKGRHVKGYGFSSFAINIGTHATKVAKNMSNKYGEKSYLDANSLYGCPMI